MPSRKKNRGKQRREAAAAKQKREAEAARKARQAPGWHELDDPGPAAAELVRRLKEDGCRIEKGEDGSTRIHHPGVREGMEEGDLKRENFNEEQLRVLAFNYVHNYAEEVKEGGFDGTAVILKNMGDPHLGQQLGEALRGAGVHLSLLHFLNQSGGSIHTLQLRGLDEQESLLIPSVWVDTLHLMTIRAGCSDDARLELAQRIEPFLTCVMDRKRELFGSNMIWHLCISSFFDLVRGIMLSDGAFLEMISHDGFLPFVAQASCWEHSRRDIVAEAKMYRKDEVDIVSAICYAAHRVLYVVIDRHEDVEGGESPANLLDQIACAPLSSKDPECTESTIVGLIRMLNHDKGDVESTEYNAVDGAFLFEFVIEPLLLTHGYVDGRVISELIAYGRADDFKGARVALNAMFSILGLRAENIPLLDSRYAAAVREGLLELCIDALVCYDFDDNSDCLRCVAKALCAMAMHSETSRALRGRKTDILGALDVLRSTSSPRSGTICTFIEDAIEAGTPICCNCLKQFDRKELRFCAACGNECYCSASCQSESHAHHRKFCGEMAAHSLTARNKGASETEVKRFECLRANLMMTGCRYIQHHVEEIRALAAEQGIGEENRMIVVVHFGHCPPEIGVVRNDTGDSGSWICNFISPVYYAFAEQIEMESILLTKVIPLASLAPR